jgi:hypothetical protein
MIRDAGRYVPCLAEAKIRRSLFEVKAVLARTEDSDAWPILVERNAPEGRIFSILGAKIDNKSSRLASTTSLRAHSFPRSAAVQGLQCEENLTGLTPECRLIPA